MDQRLEAIRVAKGVFLTSEALDLGYDDKDMTAAVRRKLWHRVRRGAYTTEAVWARADEVERHRIHVRAVMRSLGDRVAVSHVSNVVERGIATWNLDLSKVHVTRLDGASGRTTRDVVHHEGLVTDDEVERIDGMLMLRTDRAVAESLTLCGIEEGLVIADSGLHQKLLTPDELTSAFHRIEEWPNIRSAQIVVRLADGRAESPGESRVRYICWEQGLPAPELQYEVYDERGALVGITDLGWPKRGLLGEFDGRVKYGRLLRPGQQPGEVVFGEKVREDKIREASGMGLVRFIWRELDGHVEVARRIRRQFRADGGWGVDGDGASPRETGLP
jgi:hypothetical protein